MVKIIRVILTVALFLTPIFVLAQLAQNASVPEFTRSLSLGMRGNDVRSLQEYLAQDSNIYPEGLATGYFGAKTETAVKKWQKKYGIDPVGVVGPKTIAKFKEIKQALAKESTESSPTAPDANAPAAPSPEQQVETSVSTISADTTLPSVTLEVGVPAPTSVYIKFIPSEEVTAVYEYGPTINYGSAKEVTNQYSATATGISLDNLVFSKTYQVRAKATDKAGNIGYSQNYTFTTPGVDDAPKLSYGPDVTASDALPKVAVKISWGTNIPCTGTLYFGATGTFDNSRSSGYGTDHSVIIEGLGRNAIYVSKIHCDIADKALKTDGFIFVATSTDNASSIISTPFLANVLKIFETIFPNFKL